MSRYADGWDFTGRSATYLREAFDLFADAALTDPTGAYASGCRAIVEECHARALAVNAEIDTLSRLNVTTTLVRSVRFMYPHEIRTAIHRLVPLIGRMTQTQAEYYATLRVESLKRGTS